MFIFITDNNEASQTKGLIRAIENAQQVNRNLTYTKDEVTKDKLKTYAEEQKLTGIIILDVNGKVKCEYSTDNLNSRALQNEIQKKTVLDVVAYPRKTYAASIVLEMDHRWIWLHMDVLTKKA